MDFQSFAELDLSPSSSSLPPPLSHDVLLMEEEQPESTLMHIALFVEQHVDELSMLFLCIGFIFACLACCGCCSKKKKKEEKNPKKVK